MRFSSYDTCCEIGCEDTRALSHLPVIMRRRGEGLEACGSAESGAPPQKLRRDIWKRGILVSLSMRSIRSSNLNDFCYKKQIDGQIRLKEIKSACMENWNCEKGVFQEDHARDGQAIEALRIICCEETGGARQARIVELSVRQERNPTIASQLRTQIQELQNKENFYDPESGSSSGATHVPSQPSTILCPRTLRR